MNTTSLFRSTLLVALAAAPAALAAQITAPPALGPAPALILPSVDTVRMANGLTVLISRNAEVPLVTGRLIITGGARSEFDVPGLATFTATMLDEGAGERDALELTAAVSFLGASLSTNASWDATTVALSGPKRTFGDLMALAADVVLRPHFTSADIQREQALRQAGLVAERDNPGAVANRVFYRNVYPMAHPYHRTLNGDSASTALLDSATVRGFWTRAADPRRATLILTGDITTTEAREWATRYFGNWTAPVRALALTDADQVPAAPSHATRVILVDKPHAPQSVVMIGAPGISRDAPDYAAVQLLNVVLGGSFSSRLNDILREQRGYTYGAGSGWNVRPVPGPFVANSAVRTDVTDSSVAIFFREFERIRNEPVSADELERARNYSVLGALDSYETAGQVAGAISGAVTFGEPLQRTADDLAAINRVTAAQVQAAARQHLDPSRLTVVIVGDVAAIRPGIERLKLGPVEVQTP